MVASSSSLAVVASAYGRAIFLVRVGFEGIVVVLSYWLDFGKSNKHLKIFIRGRGDNRNRSKNSSESRKGL